MRTIGMQLKATTADDLTERVKILRAEREQNERGNIVKRGERELGTVWAKVYPRSTRRTVEGSVELTERVVYQITIRYRADVLSTDELEWRGRRLKQTKPPYDVEARRMWLSLECEEAIEDETIGD